MDAAVWCFGKVKGLIKPDLRPDLIRTLPPEVPSTLFILGQQRTACLLGTCAAVTGRAHRNASPGGPWSLLSVLYAGCSDLFLC